MLENSSAISLGSAGRPARVRSGSDGRLLSVRSAVTNNPGYLPRRPNPRALDRRRRDLIAAFVNALGGKGAVNDLAMLQVRRCAELQTMCEMARASMLNGVPNDMLALVRLEGACARALRVLGLKSPPPKARGLELARARWAEAEAREQKAKAKAALETGHSQRQAADILGVNHRTLQRDLDGANAPNEDQEDKEINEPQADGGANAPLDAIPAAAKTRPTPEAPDGR